MLNDILAAGLTKILNAESVGKNEVSLNYTSSFMKKVLEILNNEGYIGEIIEEDNGFGKSFKINVMGRINKCGVIKPRFSIKKVDFEKWEKRYLPAKDFGVIIISTPQGLMTHLKAKELGIGGKLIAFCY